MVRPSREEFNTDDEFLVALVDFENSLERPNIHDFNEYRDYYKALKYFEDTELSGIHEDDTKVVMGVTVKKTARISQTVEDSIIVRGDTYVDNIIFNPTSTIPDVIGGSGSTNGGSVFIFSLSFRYAIISLIVCSVT